MALEKTSIAIVVIRGFSNSLFAVDIALKHTYVKVLAIEADQAKGNLNIIFNGELSQLRELKYQLKRECSERNIQLTVSVIPKISSGIIEMLGSSYV